MAQQRDWALIETQELINVAREQRALGLPPHTIALMFSAAGGRENLYEVIADRRRQLSVTSFVISQLALEAADTGEPVTARDISRDGRRSKLHPNLDEVNASLTQLTLVAPEAVQRIHHDDDTSFSGYVLGDIKAAANRLRALADAIESVTPDAQAS